MPKPGRNAPCPCGSGVKYKRCCGRAPSALHDYTSVDREQARLKLAEFLEGPGWAELVEEAEAEFWEDVEMGAMALPEDVVRDLASMSYDVFEAWLFYDYLLEPNWRIVDAFLEAEPGLSPGERRYLRAMKNTVMRLYEVTDVEPGQAITLRDLITNDVVRVRERSGSQGLPRWTWLAARVVPRGASGHPEIDGGALPIPPPRHEAVLAYIREELEGDTIWGPEDDERARWSAIAPMLHAAWRSPLRPPKMVNYDGDPIVITKVRFAVEEPERLAIALDGASALEREEGDGDGEPTGGGVRRWSWSGKGRDRKELVLFGSFTLRDGILEVYTNSAERGERARKLVARVAGELARYQVTVTEDGEEAMRRALAEGPPGLPSPELDPEHRQLLQDVAEEHMAEHYERWLDEGIPALGGSTPRQAATGPAALRARLVAMVKDLERTYEQALARGDAAYDPTWIREELDLGAELDADRGPRGTQQPAHGSQVEPMPALVEAARSIAGRLRRERTPSFDDTIGKSELDRDLIARGFVKAHVEPLDDAVLQRELHDWLEALCNFELHLRKVFWVEPSLSWMLGATDLDLTGDAIRVPFTSFAVVFSDRYALGLAERMLSRLADARVRGCMLRCVTAYVTQAMHGDVRRVRICIACDADDGRLPSLLVRELDVPPEATLDAILDGHEPGATSPLEPVSVGSPLRRLMQLVLNAILYATSLRALPEPRPLGEESGPRTKGVVVPSDAVYFLPGTIDIGSLAQLKQLRRVGRKRRSILQRSMVRGHWRRASEGWKDPRPRWIAPHWRGPKEAAVVEKAYRLEP